MNNQTERTLNELALFAGSGGGILGGILLGWRTVCAVEINAYCRDVLLARQRDGILEPFPIWDDVQTFDGYPWRGCVDLVTGGFPCTDISVAGKGAGIEGEASGLWKEMARIIGEVQPAFAFVENSPALTVRGLDVVLGDLASMGFDARWGCVSAADAIFAGEDPAAYHIRNRIWIAGVRVHANTNGERGRPRRARGSVVSGKGLCEGRQAVEVLSDHGPRNRWWAEGTAEPMLCGMADGMAGRLERLKAIGNGQVPAVVRAAWQLLGPTE